MRLASEAVSVGCPKLSVKKLCKVGQFDVSTVTVKLAKPQLYEGRPEGELCATVVQPQRVVQKASAASLLYNAQVLLQVGYL